MLLKYTLKNMLTHPLRLIVLLICVTAASFAAFMALDASNGINAILDYSMKQFVGDTDLMLSYYGEGGITDELFAGCPEADVIMLGFGSKREVKRDEKLYNYALADSISVYGFEDFDKAHKLGVLHEKYSLGSDEIAISSKYSKEYGYKVGDKITITDYKEDTFQLTVAKIFTDEKGIINSDSFDAVAAFDVIRRQSGIDQYNMAMIDVTSGDIEGFKAQLRENEPDAEVQDMTVDEEMDKIISNLIAILYLVFILVFILVVFVTVSFAEKIVTERMSVIGTLRSIGVSRRRTTFILLAENILYGLIGSLLGIWIGRLVRPMLLNISDIDNASVLSEVMGKVKPSTYIIIIAGMILVETIVPVIELTKAVRTPIRDIIFENRDTEYRVSAVKTVIGAVLLIAGLAVGFFIRKIAVMIAAVLMIVLGAAMIVQFVVKHISRALSRLFGRLRCPVAEFASVEAGSKKSDMGNSVLAVAAITAAAAIFVIGSSMLYWTEQTSYDSDVIISTDGSGVKTEDYEFIRDEVGVDSVEFVYSTNDSMYIGEEFADSMDVYSLPAGEQFIGISGLTGSLGSDEFLMDRSLADRYGLKIGSTKKIQFRFYGFMPVEKEMTLRGYINSLSASEGGAMVIEPSLYKMLYRDIPSYILIRAGEPDTVAQDMKNCLTDGESVKTSAELTEENRRNNRGTRLLLIIAVGAAMGMTMIGIFGNQVIGFEGRRKEFALLHSTAMPRSKIRRMLLIENAVSFGISTVISALCCIPVILLVARIFAAVDVGIIISARFGFLFGCMTVLWMVVTLTSLSPMIRLRRMNTANEIKYE